MGIFKKGSKGYSILNFKCPRCNEGDLFETGSFSFQKSFFMPDNCPECGQKYFLGPGFYYGAMFISYIITGFFCLGFVAFCMFALDMSVDTSFIWLLVVMAALFVWFFRLARSIWINVNVKYDPDALKQND
ncbi:MAG: DUF983 domain-containing protein [Bacteroidetes bacterium]|jgi:uncharacterized protein (DUF983 family)|nr:DUF983 domain-containing protein [Bacteroidota bacterium]MDF1863590.1 DUF983 domain-containing protein [Saprospiraceae bacterium]